MGRKLVSILGGIVTLVLLTVALAALFGAMQQGGRQSPAVAPPTPTPVRTPPPTPLPPKVIYEQTPFPDPAYIGLTPQPTATPPAPRYVALDRTYPIGDFPAALAGGWSPDSANVALMAPNSAVWIARSDGTSVRLLTEQARSITRPIWARDGKSMVYLKGVDSAAQEVRVVSLDDSRDRLLSTAEAQPRVATKEGQVPKGPPLPLAALPGTEVLFWRGGKLFALDIATGQERPFGLGLRDAGQASSLIVSPDGTGFAWLDGYTLMGTVGELGQPRALASDVSGDPSDYAWSADSSRLAYVLQIGPDSQLWVLDFKSGAKRLLTRSPEGWRWMLRPSWSPDGRMIVLHRSPGGTESVLGAEVWLVDSGDGYAWPLSPGEKAGNTPVWSPDGTKILFFRMVTGSTGTLLNRPWIAVLRPIP